jgi:hypothetical protein
MELKIFTNERSKQRIAVMTLLAFLFCGGLFHFFAHSLQLIKENPLGPILFLISLLKLLILPFAMMGLYLRKPWGLTWVGCVIIFLVIGLEFDLVMYGIQFFFPDAWWSLSLILIFSLLVGSDLWRSSIWFQPPGNKTYMKIWMEKAGVVLGWLVLLGVPLIPAIFQGKILSLPFILRPCDSPVLIDNQSPLLPLGYQMNYPSPPEVDHVDPTEGSITLKCGQCNLILKSINSYDQQIKLYIDNSSLFHQWANKPDFAYRFLKERFGALPKNWKPYYSDKNPDYFFEIQQYGLWGSVVINKPGYTEKADVWVNLWDDNGMPLGEIYGSSASLSPQDWKWVYTIRKTKTPIWSAKKYDITAKECLAQGQTRLAGIYLASAVITDKDKSPRLKTFIEYLQKYGSSVLSNFQLHQALYEYPKDQLLKSIKLPAPRLRKMVKSQ